MNPLATLRAPPLAVQGILLMALAAGCTGGMHTLVRLAGQDLHPFLVAFFRNGIAFALMLPLLWRYGSGVWRTRNVRWQVAHCVTGVIAMLTWFTSLSMLPVADATALSFTVAIFVTIAAALFLKERVGIRRWLAVCTGFLGALIILRPGLAVVSDGALLTLVSGVFWAMALITVKVLTRVDGAMTIVFYNALGQTLLAAIPAAAVWRTPNGAEFGLLVVIAALGVVAHLLMARALKLADASAVMPVDFTRLAWAALFGFLLFGEFPDLWTWIGGAVIFASATYITYREGRKKQAPVARENTRLGG